MDPEEAARQAMAAVRPPHKQERIIAYWRQQTGREGPDPLTLEQWYQNQRKQAAEEARLRSQGLPAKAATRPIFGQSAASRTRGMLNAAMAGAAQGARR
jgi:hypothetical protein